jgi:hypothetical protein
MLVISALTRGKGGRKPIGEFMEWCPELEEALAAPFTIPGITKINVGEEENGMRIAYFADLHLGSRAYHRATEDGGNAREQDVSDAFRRAVDAALEE